MSKSLDNGCKTVVMINTNALGELALLNSYCLISHSVVLSTDCRRIENLLLLSQLSD